MKQYEHQYSKCCVIVETNCSPVFLPKNRGITLIAGEWKIPNYHSFLFINIPASSGTRLLDSRRNFEIQVVHFEKKVFTSTNVCSDTDFVYDQFFLYFLRVCLMNRWNLLGNSHFTHYQWNIDLKINIVAFCHYFECIWLCIVPRADSKKKHKVRLFL